MLLIEIRFLAAVRTAPIVPIAWRWECKRLFTWVLVFNYTIQLPRIKFRNRSTRFIWTVGDFFSYGCSIVTPTPHPHPHSELVDIWWLWKLTSCGHNGRNGHKIWAILYIHILYNIFPVKEYGSWKSTSYHLHNLFVKSHLTRSARLIVLVPVNRRIMQNI